MSGYNWFGMVRNFVESDTNPAQQVVKLIFFSPDSLFSVCNYIETFSK